MHSVDVILVPQPGFSDALALTPASKPPFRRRINHSPLEVTQQSDAVSLNVGSATARLGGIGYRQEDERHPTDYAAYGLFHLQFLGTDFARRATTFAPRLEIAPVPGHEGLTDKQPEYRAAMIATATLDAPFVLGESGP